MEVKPIRGNILVKRTSGEVKSPGGLILVQNEKPAEGEVLAVGDGALMFNGTVVPLVVEVGNTVLFKKGAGYELKVNDNDCLLLNESDILAIVK